MNHTVRIADGRAFGAWADCTCGWSSPWFPDMDSARAAKRAHYTKAAHDPEQARQLALRGRRYPDPREQLIDRCTCGDWRWAHVCRNSLCNTNLLEVHAA